MSVLAMTARPVPEPLRVGWIPAVDLDWLTALRVEHDRLAAALTARLTAHGRLLAELDGEAVEYRMALRRAVRDGSPPLALDAGLAAARREIAEEDVVRAALELVVGVRRVVLGLSDPRGDLRERRAELVTLAVDARRRSDPRIDSGLDSHERHRLAFKVAEPIEMWLAQMRASGTHVLKVLDRFERDVRAGSASDPIELAA